MKKQQAIELLGGTVSSAAKAIGVSYAAVYKWPDTLSGRLIDRVEAAVARRQHAAKHAQTAPQLVTAEAEA